MSTEITVMPDGEVIEHRAPMTLFGTDNPAAVVERASAVATSLGAVINERRLFAQIGGKKHVQVEGWTLLGSMLGVFAEVEWSRPLENGWEARAVARTLAGNVVGAAEAMCTTNEGRWRSADTYAVRSMAQTRAVSKALRMPLGFIMHLAGYSATPAEEVPDEQPEERDSGRPNAGRRADSKPAANAVPPAQYRREELAALMKERDLGLDEVERMASVIGIPAKTRATNEQMDALIDLVRDGLAERPESLPVNGGASEAPPPDAFPPKPGSDEYKALANAQQKASARAHWAEHSEPEQASMAEALGAPGAAT